MKKVLGIVLSLCMIVALFTAIPYTGYETKAALNSSGGTLNKATFILDPGHGGSDPGAVSGSREEAADVLRLSLRVGQLINSAGETAAFTRVTDIKVTLDARTDMANAGTFSYFVSIHRNSGGGVGIETYYHSNLSASSTAGKLATSVQNAMWNSGVWTKNRGVKQYNFHVCREANMPAILAEVGFVDSSVDNKIFDDHFETIALSIANGSLAMVNKSVSTTNYRHALDYPTVDGSVTNKAITASQTVYLRGNGDMMRLKGWALHTDGISAIRYKFDNGSFTNLKTYVRDDISSIPGYSDYSNNAFDEQISYAALSEGSHTITIQGLTKKNTTYTIATINLTVKTMTYRHALDYPNISGSVVNSTLSTTTTVTKTGGEDTMRLRGWALHTDGVSAIRYSFDGGEYITLPTYLRDDIAAIPGYDDYSNCGYDTYISYADLDAGEHTLTIQGISGINIAYTIATVKVIVVDESFVLIDDSEYKLNEKFVTIAEAASTAFAINEQFKCNVSVFDTKGNIIADSGVAGTGCVVKQLNGAGQVINSVVLVVIGDIDGDGAITATDAISQRQMLTQSASFDEAYLEAADLDNDGIINSADYIEMKILCKK